MYPRCPPPVRACSPPPSTSSSNPPLPPPAPAPARLTSAGLHPPRPTRRSLPAQRGGPGARSRSPAALLEPAGDGLVGEEENGGVGHHPQEVHAHAAVEAAPPLLHPHLLQAVDGGAVDLVRAALPHPRPDHLVGVGGDAGEELGAGGSGEALHLAQVLAVAPLQQAPLHVLVEDELQRALRDAPQAGHQAAVEAAEAVLAHDGQSRLPGAAVGARRALAVELHPRLDHPDRVDQDVGGSSGTDGRNQVRCRVLTLSLLVDGPLHEVISCKIDSASWNNASKHGPQSFPESKDPIVAQYCCSN
mmetsp:Transcript_63278/g.169177  ORF Transcript_63278/g.169177 Transcript_63278/m.169177 type:complete len:303 (-) Transcript_63278:327-1235(-)